MAAQELERDPRRDDEGDGERRNHRHRGPYRDRAHVRPHHPRHEGHREDRRDHRQRGQDGRVPHLVHPFDRRNLRRAIAAHHVPVDVLHHHDRIVDQDADREDEREQRDAVERVAQRVVHEEGERQRHRNGNQYHQRLTPAEEEPHEERHRERGDQQVQDQLLRLVTGSLSVVARHIERDVGREEAPARRLHALLHGVGHDGGVGPLPLGDADRHGVPDRSAGDGMRDVVRHVAEVLAHRRHVAHHHRDATARAHHDLTHLGGGRERRTDVDAVDGVRAGELAGLQSRVGLLEHLGHLAGSHPERREARGLERHRQLQRMPPGDRGLGHVGHGPDLILEVHGDLPQLVARIARRREREREDRDVVDRVRRDQRRKRAGRRLVHRRLQLGLHLRDAPLLILADLEAHRHQRVSLPRHRVDVLHAGDLPHATFDRPGEQVLDLARSRTGKRRHHVDHRDRDLRLFFARCCHDAEESHDQRCQRDQRRQLGLQEGLGDATGDAHEVTPSRRRREPRRCPRRRVPRAPRGTSHVRPRYGSSAWWSRRHWSP